MKQFKSITVQELIDVLSDLPPEAMIAFSSNYGDYHKTQQVHAIEGVAEEACIERSAYSDSGFAIVSEADDDVDEGEAHAIVYILN